MGKKKNISFEEEIRLAKEKKQIEKEKDMANDFAFLNEKDKIEKPKKEKNKKTNNKTKVEHKKNDVMEFRGEEISIKKDSYIKDEETIVKTEKSKLSIFFLILTLLVIIGYGYYLYITLDFKNLEILDIVKSLSFVLVAIVVILVLFKVNTKRSAPYVIFLTLLLMGYSIFSVSYAKEDLVYVSDFINHDYAEVLEFTSNYNIELETLHEYSDTVKLNHVIMQDYGVTTLVSSIQKFKVTISDGPNPYKEVTVPNFTGFKYDDVMKYIKENHLSNVEIEFIISDKEKDTVINQIGSGTMKRCDLIKFTFSYGEEIETEPVKDLKGLSLFEATSYLKRIGVKYEISYQFDDKVLKDYIISQDIVDEQTDNIKLVVSKGIEIKVPDFTKMTTTEIAKWAAKNNIKIKYDEVYSKDYDSGKIIKSSKIENDIIASGTEITITISLGSLIMPEIKDLSEFKLWATKNNISYEEKYEFSTTIKNGELISFSPKAGSKITENDTIVLTISKGKSVTIPNLVGLSKTDIKTKCKNVGLSCTFKYGALTEKTKRDISIAQSKKSGLIVGEGTNVTITLSSGIIEKVTIPNFVGKTKNNIISSCNSIGLTCNFNYTSNYSSTPKDTAISQDKTGTVNKGTIVNITLSIGAAKTYTVVIDGSLLTLGNPTQTKNTLKAKLESACPGVIFKFSFKSVNSGIGYLNPDSQVKVGSNTFTQGKTYNVIINSN